LGKRKGGGDGVAELTLAPSNRRFGKAEPRGSQFASLAKDFRNFMGCPGNERAISPKQLRRPAGLKTREKFLEVLQPHKLKMSDPNCWLTDEEFEAVVSEELKTVLTKRVTDGGGSI
jgi:hypothetical protein